MIFLCGSVFSLEIREYKQDETGFSDSVWGFFFPSKKLIHIYLQRNKLAKSSTAAGAVRVTRRLLASVLTRSRQKQDGDNNESEYFERLAAPTCSHRAAGPEQPPPNRLRKTGNTWTRRAAADALRHYVITSRRIEAGHVMSRVPFAFNYIFIGFLHQKLSFNII